MGMEQVLEVSGRLARVSSVLQHEVVTEADAFDTVTRFLEDATVRGASESGDLHIEMHHLEDYGLIEIWALVGEVVYDDDRERAMSDHISMELQRPHDEGRLVIVDPRDEDE